MMKKILIGLLMSAALTGGANAQYGQPNSQPGSYGQQAPYGRPGPGGWDRDAFWRGAPAGPEQRIDFLQDRIGRSIRDGSLDRGEARRAIGELNSIRDQDRRMHYRDRGPLSGRDVQILQARLDDLSRRIRWMSHSWDRRDGDHRDGDRRDGDRRDYR